VRKWAVALALAASCSSLPEAQEQVREAFETWRAAAAAGDAEKTFKGMSASFKSDWVFQRLVARDPVALDWRARMEGAARTDLDLWLEHQKKYRQGRAETLPATVLAHPSLGRMWVECFSRDREAVKVQFSGLAVSRIYLDEGGATVMTRNMINKGEMYSMVVEADSWKVDGHRESLRSLQK
jgi:hypothetical protein